MAWQILLGMSLKIYPISKQKQNYPAIYPQQPTSIGRLKLHSLQVNLLMLATGKLPYRLN